MSNHPLNLIVRFILELLLLAIMGYWGWCVPFGGGILMAIAVPAIAATGWGVFRVEGDPGKAPVPIPGWLRLVYEGVLFTSATYMLYSLKPTAYTVVFVVIWLTHYVLSYDRIGKLLRGGISLLSQ